MPKREKNTLKKSKAGVKPVAVKQPTSTTKASEGKTFPTKILLWLFAVYAMTRFTQTLLGQKKRDI